MPAAMPDRKPVDTLAIGLMVLLTATWGLQQVALKVAAPDMAPVFQIALRSGVAAVLIGALVLWRGEIRGMAAVWKPGLLAGFFFALEFLLVGEGLKHTSASHMSIYLYTAPIFTALGLHWKVPEERLSPVQWGGILTAFAGVATAFAGQGAAPAGDTAWLGDLMGIGAGMALAATTLTIRLSRLATARPAGTLLYQLLVATAVLGGMTLLTGQTAFTVTPALVTSLGFQAILVCTISFLAWFALLRTYPVLPLTTLTFLTPVFGATFGVVWLKDPLSPGFVAGSLLVLAGIVIVSGHALLKRKAGAAPDLA